MKSFKRLVVFMLVLSMVIGTMVPAFAFSDVEDTYYEDEINKLAAVGVVNGDPEGTFRPDDNITRAEVAVIICKMLGAGNTMDAQKNMPSAFSDVAAGEWYTGAVNLATGNGVIAGFPDGTFRPNDNITVAQAVTLMVKALGRGVYVDEAGQWPANYIAEAAKLGVTANIVAGAQDDLANRGMVSAMAWNSLDIAVWDVDSTNNKGEILSGKTETMLELYFKDFVTEKAGELKWAEEIDVDATYITDKTIANGQIIVDYAAVAEQIDGFEAKTKKRVKDADTMTYYTGTYSVADDGEVTDTRKLVVYVADENVSAAELLNKKVDIMFGKDNVATLVVVREDAETDMLTKYLKADDKIVVGSEEYKLAANVDMTINNEKITSRNAKTVIDEIITEIGGTINTKTITKAIKVNISLDEKDKVEKIAFEVSGNFDFDFAGQAISVKQLVAEEIDDEIIECIDGTEINIEKLAEEDDVITVLKDGEEIALTDIAVGDVITFTADKVENATVMYVSSEKVTGTVDKIKQPNVIVVDGTAYYSNKGLVGSLNNDLEKTSTFFNESAKLNDLVKEEVTIHVNYLGEAVVVLADAEGGDWNFGIVKDARTNDSEDLEYTRIRVKILNADGEDKVYYVFEEEKDIDENKAVPAVSGSKVLAKGDFVAYRVTGENLIDIEDDIKVINAETATPFEVADEDYYVIKGNGNVDYSEETIRDYEFDADSVVFCAGLGVDGADENTKVDDHEGSDKVEVIKAGFDALVSKTENIVDSSAYIVYSDEDDTIKYVVVDGKTPFVTTDDDYGFVVNMDMIEDDEYEVTLYVEGEELVYKTNGINVNFTENDFIKYEITGAGKLEAVAEVIINVEELNILDEDLDITGLVDEDALTSVMAAHVANGYDLSKEHLTVKNDGVTKSAVKFEDKKVDNKLAAVKFAKDDDEFDGVIYDLSDIDAPAMVSNIADVENKVVLAIDSEEAGKADIFVIIAK